MTIGIAREELLLLPHTPTTSNEDDEILNTTLENARLPQSFDTAKLRRQLLQIRDAKFAESRRLGPRRDCAVFKTSRSGDKFVV